MTALHIDSQWLADGACKQHPEIDFFVADGASQREPLEICATCVVQAACLDYALSGHEFGIWGGTTERGRAHMRRSSRRELIGIVN